MIKEQDFKRFHTQIFSPVPFLQRTGFIIFMLLLLATGWLSAQPKQNITMVVIDSISKEPVSATIRFAAMNEVYKTNEKGAAAFSIKPGRYVMIVSSVGYAVKTVIVAVTENAPVTIMVGMVIASKVLTHVTVIGLSKEDAEARAIKQGVMPQTALRGWLAVFGKDVIGDPFQF